MKLVVNASPLIFLSKIDSLALLEACFEEILVPPAVVAEARLELPGFIRVAGLSAVGHAYVRGALGRLHAGELEVMVLAQESGIDLVALDDLLARRKARQIALQPIGTVGILLLGHRRGLLDAATANAKIDQLVDAHGLYISNRVLQTVKAQLA